MIPDTTESISCKQTNKQKNDRRVDQERTKEDCRNRYQRVRQKDLRGEGSESDREIDTNKGYIRVTQDTGIYVMGMCLLRTQLIDDSVIVHRGYRVTECFC